jgi:hypothetical protein
MSGKALAAGIAADPEPVASARNLKFCPVANYLSYPFCRVKNAHPRSDVGWNPHTPNQGWAMRSISIDLTTLMTEILQEIIRSRLPGIAVIQRARCILLAHGKMEYVAISQAVQLSAKAVGRWVRRFADSLEALRHVEKTGVRAALTRAIIDCLRDAPRSGAPKKFTPAEVTCMISIACEDPEKSNRPVTSWTVREIASEAVLRNIVTSVSVSQVQRFLNQVQLRHYVPQVLASISAGFPSFE